MRHLLLALLFSVAGCAGAGASLLTEDQGRVAASDGAPVSLAEVWRHHPATVLVWWSSTCPCVGRYRERVADLAARYAARDVAFYYVASNADDGPEEIAEATGPVPIVRDEGGALARTLGVISTPTVAVIDVHGAVRFLGWLDNEHTPGDADREPWLEAHLDDLLAGGNGTRQTPVWGCSVTRSLAEKKSCHSPAPPPVASEVAPVQKCGGH